MQNSTYSHPSMLTLTFGELTSVKYVYILLTFIIYMLIILCNCAVISVVVLYKPLHEPMYIFISVLCINGLYGSSTFYPSVIVNLFYTTQTISYYGCITQVFCVHTYAGCEMTLLTVMAFDRYVCICNPLRYNTIISITTVFKLIVGAWSYTIVLVSIHLVLTVRLPLCDTVILKTYCDNWSVVRLSCVDVTVNNVFGLFIATTFVAVMPVLILFSYILILRACARMSKDFRAKALQTCTPHLITIVNYTANLFFELLIYRFFPMNFPYALRTVMSVQVLVGPPLLNPLIYGMKIKEIRIRILQLFHLSNILSHNINI
ncbi:olfactory receptor 52D1-like [Pelodytes ibericus]